MTTRSLLARLPRRLLHHTSSPALVVALLLLGVFAGLQPRALADGIPLRSGPPLRTSTIDGTVSAVTGTVLDVIGGQFQIDVANAVVTSGDGPLAEPIPANAIPVGARVVAQVVVPNVAAAVVPPPPFQATNVAVFLPRDGALDAAVQSVDAASASFTMFFHSISTNTDTKWSGFGPSGTVKGIGDLTAGMFAAVSVVTRSGVLLATSVEAWGGLPPPRLVAFRGPVQSIAATQWQIDGRVVQVNAATKIVGDPKVGDTVDVLLDAPTLPPGVGTAVIPVALSIVKTVVIVPPGPGGRATEFDGVVESIPPVSTAGGTPLGHWKISSRDVVVNGLTRLDSGIVVGTSVHVKGAFLLGAGAGGSPFETEFVAVEIRKR
jgi:hypothetical protein